MKYENKCSEDRNRNIDFIGYSYEACTTVMVCHEVNYEALLLGCGAR